MKQYTRLFIVILISVLLFSLTSSCDSCNKKSKNNKFEKVIHKNIPIVEKEEIDTFQLNIYRYEQALFKLDPVNPKPGLEKIKKDYLFFLDGDLNDPVNISQIKSFINDPVLKHAYNDINKIYGNNLFFKEPLKYSLLRYKKIIKEAKIPKVYTYISGFLYEKPVIFLDSVLIIGLDCYMGKNYKLYSQMKIPAYSSIFMQKEYIVRDCMFAIGEKSVPQPDKSKTLLDLMIYRGKILYFTDLVLENTPDSVKIKYTSSQLDWCIRNEANIWAFFIEKNILFSKDHETARKFLADGPFTSVFTKNSPARTGEYIGWQIVRTFMKKNPEMSFKDLIKQDAQKILNESSYKPKR